jgi:hypothetical protein
MYAAASQALKLPRRAQLNIALATVAMMASLSFLSAIVLGMF